jgi:hypothetical protein
MNKKEYYIELIDYLGAELLELWNECSMKCNSIEKLLKEVKKK